jgi:hypothetical protein
MPTPPPPPPPPSSIAVQIQAPKSGTPILPRSSTSMPPPLIPPGVSATASTTPSPAKESSKSPYPKKEPKNPRKTMRAPSQRKGPPPPKYMFFPRHHSQTNPNPNPASPSSSSKSSEIDLLRCNIWQRDSSSQLRWGSVQTGWIQPPPDASVTDKCRRSDIVCAVNGDERVVASLFWRNGLLSSVVVQGKEAIIHREEYKHVLHAAPIGFSWPDGHRFFTWTPVDGQEDVSGVVC